MKKKGVRNEKMVFCRYYIDFRNASNLVMWYLTNLYRVNTQTETNTSNVQLEQKAAYAQAPQQRATYVGVEKCKSCHPQEYKDYTERKFDKAWRILEMRGETRNPECLKCHVTGYGEPTGFVNAEATPHLKFKQCEACHGPGSIHASNPGNREAHEGMRSYVRDKDICIKCHVCMKAHRGESF